MNLFPSFLRRGVFVVGVMGVVVGVGVVEGWYLWLQLRFGVDEVVSLYLQKDENITHKTRLFFE